MRGTTWWPGINFGEDERGTMVEIVRNVRRSLSIATATSKIVETDFQPSTWRQSEQWMMMQEVR